VAEPASEPSADSPATRTDARIDLREQWSRISRNHQAAHLLVDIMGYPVIQAAQILGVSEGTLKKPPGATGKTSLNLP
jgi:RNA polymerase sigma-70 factor (ECF subfamily)